MNHTKKILMICGFSAAVTLVSVQGAAQPIQADPAGTITTPPATATTGSPAAEDTAAAPSGAAPGTVPAAAAPAAVTPVPATTTTTTTTTTGAVQPASPDTTRAAPVSNGGTVPGTEQPAEANVTTAAPAPAALSSEQPPPAWNNLQNLDYRRIDTIKWPSRQLAVAEIREKYKGVWEERDVIQFRIIFNDYCLQAAQLYQREIEREWRLTPGLLSLDRACDSLRALASTATAADSYLFEYPNPLVLRTFDQLTYRFYASPAYKINEQLNSVDKKAAEPAVVAAPEEDASLFGMLGVPAGFVPFVVELLLLLALMLNFFLLYKVFKK